MAHNRGHKAKGAVQPPYTAKRAPSTWTYAWDLRVRNRRTTIDTCNRVHKCILLCFFSGYISEGKKPWICVNLAYGPNTTIAGSCFPGIRSWDYHHERAIKDYIQRHSAIPTIEMYKRTDSIQEEALGGRMWKMYLSINARSMFSWHILRVCSMTHHPLLWWSQDRISESEGLAPEG